MVKLSAELIGQSPQYTNPLRDREIDLRGCKISVIENLGATLDQFDCIDFSDNDIKKIEGFSMLKRLKMLLLNNNRVCRIEENLQHSLPQLNTLVLTNNNMQELADLDPLVSVKTLEHLCLLRNPIANKQNYRYYAIFKLPQLRVIDFQRIRLRERKSAQRLFSGKRGENLQKEIAMQRSKTFEVKDPTEAREDDEKFLAEKYKDQEAIKEAISKASTLEEVRKLELLLQKGHIPGKSVDKVDDKQTNGHAENGEELEEMET